MNIAPSRSFPLQTTSGISNAYSYRRRAALLVALTAGAWPCGAAVTTLSQGVPITGFSGDPGRDLTAPAEALLTGYSRAGWQASLSTRAHGVRGTVTIVDANTSRVDDFYYDGGGINVHFILAARDDNASFRNDRLVTDLNLLGTAWTGGSLSVDLPEGTSFDGYNAISLWCVPAQANFGSGTFFDPVPEPSGVTLLGLATGTALVRRRRPRFDNYWEG